ncbi:hypothetical protein M3Y99_00190200 [Aphelenchoides fujianensis]|nr:hypothetical protein M3Y99_00190200 [Aphelenchoides fujianensis]
MNPTTLRGAHSTPYIRQPSEENPNEEKENSTENLGPAAQRFRPHIQFNAGGCSSSSSDLSQLVYHDSSDPLVVQQWALLYEQQGRKNKSPSAKSDSNGFFSDSLRKSEHAEGLHALGLRAAVRLPYSLQ